MDFPKIFKELRIKHGLTQEELGKMLNISKANLSKYEKGLSQPKMATLINLAEIFNVTVDTLLGVDHRHSLNTKTEAGRQAAAEYWAKLLRPEFDIQYRDGYFYLIALQDVSLELYDIKAGTDFKISPFDFEQRIEIIKKETEKETMNIQKENAKKYFKRFAEFDIFAPFLLSAATNGVSRKELNEKIKFMYYRHNEDEQKNKNNTDNPINS